MSSTRRFCRQGDRRIDQKPSIGNQHHGPNRGSLSIQRNQRGQHEEHCWNSTMNRQCEDHHFRSSALSRYRCSQRTSESWRRSAVQTMIFPGKSRRNESQDHAKRVESAFNRKTWSRYRRTRESGSILRGRDRKRRPIEGWNRNSRSISRERFLNLGHYWTKSHSKSSAAHRSAVEPQEEIAKFERNVSKCSDPRPRSAPRRQSPAKVRVENLTSNVTKGHLIEIFSRCGRVKNVEFNRHCRGDPRAFIEFYSKTDAEHASRTMNEGEIDGKLIEVTLLGSSSKLREAARIFRHRSPLRMPHAMMITSGRPMKQRQFVDPVRDKVNEIRQEFNRKRKY